MSFSLSHDGTETEKVHTVCPSLFHTMELKRKKYTQFVCSSLFRTMELKRKKIYIVCLFICLSDDWTETEKVHSLFVQLSFSRWNWNGKSTQSLFVLLSFRWWNWNGKYTHILFVLLYFRQWNWNGKKYTQFVCPSLFQTIELKRKKTTHSLFVHLSFRRRNWNGKSTQFVCPALFRTMELKRKKTCTVCLFISLSDDGTETEKVRTVCLFISLSDDGTETVRALCLSKPHSPGGRLALDRSAPRLPPRQWRLRVFGRRRLRLVRGQEQQRPGALPAWAQIRHHSRQRIENNGVCCIVNVLWTYFEGAWGTVDGLVCNAQSVIRMEIVEECEVEK